MKTQRKDLIIGAAGVLVGALSALAVKALYERRCKKKEEEQAAKGNPYETQRMVEEYLMMHFGKPEALLPAAYRGAPVFGPEQALGFPKRCAQVCIELGKSEPTLGPGARVLDIGCAVGGATFELARYFEEVVGVDYSKAFVNAANQMKELGELPFEMTTEGDLRERAIAAIDPEIDRKRCTFVVGDACNLSPDLGKFGLVLGANLVDRLPKPRAFLSSVGDFIIPGGYLVLTSPYTWLESFTPRSEWIGGYRTQDGREITSLEGLKEALKDKFELVKSENMPFFIRETARKNQWTVANLTVWKRK